MDAKEIVELGSELMDFPAAFDDCFGACFRVTRRRRFVGEINVGL